MRDGPGFGFSCCSGLASEGLTTHPQMRPARTRCSGGFNTLSEEQRLLVSAWAVPSLLGLSLGSVPFPRGRGCLCLWWPPVPCPPLEGTETVCRKASRWYRISSGLAKCYPPALKSCRGLELCNFSVSTERTIWFFSSSLLTW